MSEIVVYSTENKKVGSVELPKEFGEKTNSGLLYQVVMAQRTNRRQGNAKVKNRHEVTGSTRKIYRQKGTGGARHGDIKAPIFVGGGRAFGPKPRHYEVRLTQKIRRAALRAALLDRQSEGKLFLVDAFDFKAPKTKKASEIFEKLGIPSALVVLEKSDSVAEKSIRNLEKFKATRVEAVTVLDILRYKHLVMSKGSFEQFIKNCS